MRIRQRAKSRASVFNANQEQALWRGGRAGGAAIHGAQDFAGPGLRPGAAAHFDQRADDGADHVVEESVSLDLDCDKIVGGPPLPCRDFGAIGSPRPQLRGVAAISKLQSPIPDP